MQNYFFSLKIIIYLRVYFRIISIPTCGQKCGRHLFFRKQRGTVLSDQDCTIIPLDFSILTVSANPSYSTHMVWEKNDDPASLNQTPPNTNF